MLALAMWRIEVVLDCVGKEGKGKEENGLGWVNDKTRRVRRQDKIRYIIGQVLVSGLSRTARALESETVSPWPAH